MAITVKGSALSSAANNIVSVNSRSKGSVQRLVGDHRALGRDLDAGAFRLNRIEFPKPKDIKAFSSVNVLNTFGSLGGMLRGLYSSKLDIGGLVRGVFTGKGNKIGRSLKVASSTSRPRPIIRGNRIRLSGPRAIGVSNSIFSGLDFATGLSGNELRGSVASSASGSLAGSLLSGAIGKSLVPVPGLGFILAGSVGLAVGGLGVMGISSFMNTSQNARRRQEQRLEEGRSGDNRDRVSRVDTTGKQKTILNSFNESVGKFQSFVKNLLDGKITFGAAVMDDIDSTSPGAATQQPAQDEILTTEGGELPSKYFYSPYGPRGNKPHRGVDYAIDANTPVSLIVPGRVSYSGWDEGGYGNFVIIEHSNGIESLYGHLNKINVKVGQEITPGTVIGLVGSTGRSTGPHVHFELRKKGESTGFAIPNNEGDKYFRFGGNVRVTSARPMDSLASSISPTELRPGSTVATQFGRQSSMATTNIAAGRTTNIKGYIVVPGHIAGGGTEGERAAVEKIAINVVNKLKAMYPTAQVRLWNNRSYGNSDPEFKRQMNDLKKLEDQGWEIIELHFDAPNGTGRGVILPYDRSRINPLESILAGTQGAYPLGFRDNLAGPRRGFSLLELGNMTDQLRSAFARGDQSAVEYFSRDILSAFERLARTGMLPGVSASQSRSQVQAPPAASAAPRPSAASNLNINYQTSYNQPSQVIIVNRPTVTMVPMEGSSSTPQMIPIPTGGGGKSSTVIIPTSTNPLAILNKIQEYRLT